jgi:short-subunit dehydrogenase
VFSELGAHVILSSRSEDKLKAVAKQCMGETTVFPLDLSDPEATLQKATEFARTNKVDILINNGGISQRFLAEETLESLDGDI